MSYPETTSAIVLGLITCRNPDGLEKLLRVISADDMALLTRIIVVDNDAQQAAMKLCARLKANGEFTLVEAFYEPRPGIAFARNRVLLEASKAPFEYVAMLDDDEYPSAGWLSALHQRAQETGADVVAGPVIPVLEADPGPSILVQDYVHTTHIIKNGRVMIGATSNLLISRKVVLDFDKNWFSEKYALTGCSDSEFLWRVFRAGYCHAFSPDAVAEEDIPSWRLTEDWLKKRAYRVGNGLVRIRGDLYGKHISFIRDGFSLFGLIVQIGIVLVGSTPNARKRLLVKLKWARLCGKCDAFRGKSYQEYKAGTYR